MAKFKRGLWDDADKPDSKDQLLLATLLWLRTYNRDSPQWLGLVSMVELLVPFDRDMKLGLGVPELPRGKIIVSDGSIIDVEPSSHGRFLYCSRTFSRELDLDLFDSLHISYVVHIRWIEWALATAILMLAESGNPWTRDNAKPIKTVGGFETADFLKF